MYNNKNNNKNLTKSCTDCRKIFLYIQLEREYSKTGMDVFNSTKNSHLLPMVPDQILKVIINFTCQFSE